LETVEHLFVNIELGDLKVLTDYVEDVFVVDVNKG